MIGTANGQSSSISGGRRVIASGNFPLISGGYNGGAAGQFVNITGRYNGTASGNNAAIPGGHIRNVAASSYASPCRVQKGTTLGESPSVHDSTFNTASTDEGTPSSRNSNVSKVLGCEGQRSMAKAADIRSSPHNE